MCRPEGSTSHTCLVVHFEIYADSEVSLHPKLTQDFLDRVEARIIRAPLAIPP